MAPYGWMRNRPIHGYFGVDHELVWEMVKTKVAALHERLERIPRSSPRSAAERIAAGDMRPGIVSEASVVRLHEPELGREAVPVHASQSKG